MSEETGNIAPYVHLLAGRAPDAVLRETLPAVETILQRMTPEEVGRRPESGKWSFREQMCHMADCEVAWAWRLRQTYGEDKPALQPFEQDPWARAYDGVLYTADRAYATWHTLREWNLALIETFSEADKARPAVLSSTGEVTLWTLVEVIAGHDLHHLQRWQKLGTHEV